MNNAHQIQTSVDPVIFTVFGMKLHILLVKRNIEPYKDCWALPGGLVDEKLDQDLHSAALRKLKEKTNVTTHYLEQVETLGSASRDPRGWSVTVVYFALVTVPEENLSAAHGASEVRWEEVGKNGVAVPLAFDHEKLVKAAVERLRAKVSYTTVAAGLLAEPFTFLDLQNIHEIILNRKVEKKSLMRRYESSGLLVEVNETRKTGRMRPAKLYRLKDRETVHYFVRTMEGPR
jgi:ADP-ribose pyrophosphatase YjhB (NUDIX family)